MEPGRAARPLLREEDDALPAVDELLQRRPLAADRAGVREVVEPGLLDLRDEVLRLDGVLHHDDHDVAGVRDEEVAQRDEHLADRRAAELAERVAEVHAALALALEARAVAEPQRRVDRVRAHAVLERLPAQLAGVVDLRAQPAVGSLSA